MTDETVVGEGKKPHLALVPTEKVAPTIEAVVAELEEEVPSVQEILHGVPTADDVIPLHKKFRLRYFSTSHGKYRFFVSLPDVKALEADFGEEVMKQVFLKLFVLKHKAVAWGDHMFTVGNFKPTFSYVEAEGAQLSKAEADKIQADLFKIGYVGFHLIKVE